MDNGILCFVAHMIIEDKIDGGTFIKLPCDQGKLKEELKLTLGGANNVAILLSEVHLDVGKSVMMCLPICTTHVAIMLQ